MKTLLLLATILLVSFGSANANLKESERESENEILLSIDEVDGWEKWRDKYSAPFSKLDKAVGQTSWTWTSCDWQAHNNEIEDLDTFDRWDFGIVTLHPFKKQFLYLRKNYSYYCMDGSQFLYSEKLEKAYILDPEQYRDEIGELTNTGGELNLTVIERVTRNSPSAAVNIWQYDQKKDARVKNFESEYEELVIKVKFEKETNKAKFLIYPMVKGEIPNEAFDDKYRFPSFVGESERKVIEADKIWDNFYYETDYDLFIDFIESPLKKI